MYGFLLTTYNDLDKAVEAYNSLLASIPPDTSFKIVVADGGSSPEQIQKIHSEIGVEPLGPFEDLSTALNEGFFNLLGYTRDNIKYFVEEGNSSMDYLFWIHVDMLFTEYNWAEKLIFCYEHLFPLIGRLGPATSNIDHSNPDIEILHGSNQCPLMYSSRVLRDMIAKYGNIYDEDYKRCFGYEDWDCGRRLLEIGYGFGVCTLVDVNHLGMYSRSREEPNWYKSGQISNADVYGKKWGTWNQPGFEVLDQMKDVKLDLRKAYEARFPHRWYDGKVKELGLNKKLNFP